MNLQPGAMDVVLDDVDFAPEKTMIWANHLFYWHKSMIFYSRQLGAEHARQAPHPMDLPSTQRGKTRGSETHTLGKSLQETSCHPRLPFPSLHFRSEDSLSSLSSDSVPPSPPRRGPWASQASLPASCLCPLALRVSSHHASEGNPFNHKPTVFCSKLSHDFPPLLE